jgi:hypothetical protein
MHSSNMSIKNLLHANASFLTSITLRPPRYERLPHAVPVYRSPHLRLAVRGLRVQACEQSLMEKGLYGEDG